MPKKKGKTKKNIEPKNTIMCQSADCSKVGQLQTEQNFYKCNVPRIR